MSIPIAVLLSMVLGCRSTLSFLLDEEIDCLAFPTRYYPGFEFHTNWNHAGAWLADMRERRIRNTWFSGAEKIRLVILPHDFPPVALTVTRWAGNTSLEVDHAPGAGGWRPEDGDASLAPLEYPESEVELQEEDWMRIDGALREFDFWNRPRGPDWTQMNVIIHPTAFIIERADRHRYHFISRGDAAGLEEREPELAEICRLIVDQARLTPKGPYEFCGLTPPSRS